MEVEIGDWRHLEFNDATFVHLAFSRSRVEASLETGRDRPAMQSINQHGCNKFIQLAYFKHVFFDLVIFFWGWNQRSQFLIEAASWLIVIDQDCTICIAAVSQQRDDIGMGQGAQDLYPQKKESREFQNTQNWHDYYESWLMTWNSFTKSRLHTWIPKKENNNTTVFYLWLAQKT